MNIQPFYVIGIAVRTTNENNQAATDIPALWNTFITGDVAAKIPDKTDQSVYSIYTDYEKDHTRPYTTILGCRVANLDNIPEGMVGKAIEGGTYTAFTAKGKPDEGIVYNEWVKIWNSELERTYTSDFEVYGPKAQDPANAEIDIFIAVK
jgi:predicted transcriptional regulator YdeE